MSKPPPNPEHPNRAQFVRVAGCHAASRQGPRGSELVAVLTFVNRRTLLDPLALSFLQVQVLINDLTRLLSEYSGAHGGGAAISDDDPQSGLPPAPPIP